MGSKIDNNKFGIVLTMSWNVNQSLPDPLKNEIIKVSGQKKSFCFLRFSGKCIWSRDRLNFWREKNPYSIC